jgi:hypothetical protein
MLEYSSNNIPLSQGLQYIILSYISILPEKIVVRSKGGVGIFSKKAVPHYSTRWCQKLVVAAPQYLTQGSSEGNW